MIQDIDFNIACEESIELSAYIDGELDDAATARFERHLDDCVHCREELNEQKFFLMALESSLRRDGDLELPKDFAREIIVKAETSVSGLRRPYEMFSAIFVSAALFFFALFALSAGAADGGGWVRSILGQSAAVALVAGQLIYSILLSVIVILRSLTGQLPVMPTFYLLTVAAAMFLFLLVTRRVLREWRA